MGTGIDAHNKSKVINSTQLKNDRKVLVEGKWRTHLALSFFGNVTTPRCARSSLYL
jgi:hypothetical protein